MADNKAEKIARLFHETYEAMAPHMGWATQIASRKDWDDVPTNNRDLMVAVVASLMARGVIEPGPELDDI